MSKQGIFEFCYKRVIKVLQVETMMYNPTKASQISSKKATMGRKHVVRSGQDFNEIVEFGHHIMCRVLLVPPIGFNAPMIAPTSTRLG